MALGPIQILTATGVTLANGARVIYLPNGENASFVFQGTAVFIDGLFIGEGIEGTAETNGTSTITLRENYNGADINNGSLGAFNTIEGLGNAIFRIEQAVASLGDIVDLPDTGRGLLEKVGDTDYDIREISDATDVLSPASVKIPRVSDLYSFLLGSIATESEAEEGISNNKVITPANLSYKLNTLGYDSVDLIDNYGGNDANSLPHTGRSFLVNAQNVPSAGNWFIDYAFTNGNNFSTGLQYATQSGTEKIYFRRSVSTVWQPWLELYHTGNNIDARQYGVGINEQDKDNDTVSGTQIFRARTDQGATLPSGLTGAHTLYMQRVEGAQASQLIIEDSGSLINNPYIGFRQRGNGTDWGDFFKILHEGNTNLNRFGFKANGIFAQGVGVTATIATFHLPLNSPTSPISVTLTGTFSLLNAVGAVVRSGIPASDLAFAPGPSTGKIARVNVNNNLGLTADTTYLLRSETNSSGLEVNY